MAYPFAQAPTVKDFADAAKGVGCTCEHIDGITGPRGPVVISYLQREIGDSILVSEPLPESAADRLSPDTLRRLCAQLQMDVKAFGLELG